jgi:hypothetical protein
VLNDAEANSKKSEYLYLMAESDFNKLKKFIVQQAGVDEHEIKIQDYTKTLEYMVMMRLNY